MMGSGKYTLLTLTKKLEELGYQKRTYSRKTDTYEQQPFAKGYLDYMLHNDSYLGKVKHHSGRNPIKGTEAIIDEKTFEQVLKVLKKHAKPRLEGRVQGKYFKPISKAC